MPSTYRLRDTAHPQPYTMLADLCRHQHTSAQAARSCRDAKRAARQLPDPDSARVMRSVTTHRNGARWEPVDPDNGGDAIN